jgi:23S rRNA pseudouridine2604 synthase
MAHLYLLAIPMTEPVRLAKRVAELTRCSRREAEMYIEGGWVRVDGEVAEEPQLKVLDQRIEIDPNARLEPAEPATILLHKPLNNDTGPWARSALPMITAATRSADDASGIHSLKRHFSRLSAPMPLDHDASGLLVLTQDWRVVRRLSEDAERIEQEYVVEVTGALIADGLQQLNHGLSYHGKPLPPCKVSWQSENRLRFAIKSVQQGQLRQMCADVGLAVVAIKRIRIGRIPLSRMAVGEWRYLPIGERF